MQYKYCLRVAFVLGLIAAHAREFSSGQLDEEEASIVNVPNSCIGQDDNDDTIVKLADGQSYPLVHTKCRNEFMIVDVNQDDSWADYFVSMRKYHYNLLGPGKDDHVNWQEWMTVAQDEFLISPDCHTCDAHFELNDKYKTQSAYYMTPVADGCTQLPIGRIGCDMDWHTYACRVCETVETREPGYWISYEVYNGLNDADNTFHFIDEVDEENFAKYGLCGFTVRDAKADHSAEIDTFEHCKTVTHDDVEGEGILPRRKPSMGLDGRFCMCVKPEEYSEYQVPKQQLVDKVRTDSEAEDASSVWTSDAKVDLYRLWQKDFEHGTYRILKPGKYIVMEDITFDFKAPEGYMQGGLDTYNGPGDWWPTYDQIDDYPGAGDLKDPYFLGFWAGITIEADNVILELNHHTLEMSEALYYQQSFFALISLTSQVFLPGQGPGFFGASPVASSNVMIRNGELGLTSHHAIQGNFNKNVLLENLKIRDFKTHGVQFNGFDGVTIRNVDVGPNRKLDMLTPYYAHMKALLPTYRMIVENEQTAREECFQFVSDGRKDECYYLQDMIETVQTLLDMAFEYVVVGVNWDDRVLDADDDDDQEGVAHKIELWQKYRDVLINDHHSTQTATLYGIFLNYIGSNVIGWYAGSETTKSQNVVMDNVKIHDLHHDTYENIAFSQGVSTASQRILNCLNAPFNAYHVFGEDQVPLISECNNYYDENAHFESETCQRFRRQGLNYVGNPITDIQIASFELINRYGLSWNYCSAGAADMGALADFAIRGTPFEAFTPLLVATHDPMIHPGKGVMGLRLNGVDAVDITDLWIENVHSSTDIGTTLGGPYEQVVSQQAPYMNGYSMNMVNGATFTFTTNVQLSNVYISHVVSDTGLAYGLAAWYETSIDIVGKKGLQIDHVHAGRALEPSDKFRRDSFPNLKPEGCAFRIYDDVIYGVTVDYEESEVHGSNLKISCIHGHTGCLMESEEWTNVGDVSDCEDIDDYDSSSSSTSVAGVSESRGGDQIDFSLFANFYATLPSKGLYALTALVVLSLVVAFYLKCMTPKWTKIDRSEFAPLLPSQATNLYH